MNGSNTGGPGWWGKGGEHDNCVYIAQKDLEGRNNSRESLRAAPNSSLAEKVLHLHPSLPAPFPHRTSESETAYFIHSYPHCCVPPGLLQSLLEKVSLSAAWSLPPAPQLQRCTPLATDIRPTWLLLIGLPLPSQPPVSCNR